MAARLSNAHLSIFEAEIAPFRLPKSVIRWTPWWTHGGHFGLQYSATECFEMPRNALSIS